MTEKRQPKSDLTDPMRRWLLAHARRTIGRHLRGESIEAEETIPAEVAFQGGCFVTLHKRDGSLRGCIGTFADQSPVWRNIRDMAIAAATRDPRFSPLTMDELEECILEISVLTPSRPVFPEEVEVGRHGITVEKGVRRGVLLPQVANDHRWDRDTFLSQTCVKAGLGPNEWRDGSVKIEVFSAEVFGEP